MQRGKQAELMSVQVISYIISQQSRADRLQRESVNAARTPAATLRRQSSSSRTSERRSTLRISYTQHNAHTTSHGNRRDQVDANNKTCMYRVSQKTDCF